MTVSPSPTASERTPRRPLPAEFGIAIVLVCVYAFFAWRAPHFAEIPNLRLISKQAAQLAILATGMTLVIATGGIDISVGSLVALCTMVLGWLSATAGWNPWLACIGAILVGAACGLANGLLIAKAKLPPPSSRRPRS